MSLRWDTGIPTCQIRRSQKQNYGETQLAGCRPSTRENNGFQTIGWELNSIPQKGKDSPLFIQMLGSTVSQMQNVLIRQLVTGDWELYRDIRLRSLQESPEAFSSTFNDEFKFTPEKWQERVGVSGRVHSALPLIAEHGGSAVGIAFGVVHSPSDEYGYIYQMWVDPRHRGKGIGKLLLYRIVEWAKDIGICGLELAVSTSNEAALQLYKSAGFAITGKFEPLRIGSTLKVQKMRLGLK